MNMPVWKRLIERPDLLFLLLAIPFGLLFLALVPPLGNSDESFHYQRIASIAYFQLMNEPASIPSGIQVFIQAGQDFFHEGLAPPFHYPHSQWQAMAHVPLHSCFPPGMQPNYMTVHNPFNYLPQAIAFRIGAAIGLTPMSLLYLSRLIALAMGIGLTYAAIRTAPTHKYLLCALALLPVISVTRSALNADTLVESLAFLFVALILRTIQNAKTLQLRDMALIAATGFAMAQCKTPYGFLLLLTAAIPPERFTSARTRIFFLILSILPAIACSLAWMIAIKNSTFAGLQYHTWGGDAYPQMQTLFILHHPLDFLCTLLRTLFTTPLLPVSILGIVRDMGLGSGFYLSIPVTFAVIYCFIATAIADPTSSTHYPANLKTLSAFIFIIAFTAIMALLYIHWSGLESPLISGFQGRYFYPLLPLLFPFIKTSSKKLMSQKPGTYILLMGCGGLAMTGFMLFTNYY
ncbi:MAG TPA: DUF2142 domain-containing protein [Rickettsiales bacterium]|nr:DUF2142 domain-containing protein [Rickettsiales bacterium]